MEKNILIVTTTSDFLGKFEQDNVRTLQSLGYEVHYATNIHEPAYHDSTPLIRSLGVHLHPIAIARSPYQLRANLTALRQLIHLIDRHHTSLLHCHTPVGGILGRLAARLSPRRPRVIYTAHGFHFYHGAPLIAHLLYYPAERLLARLTDVLIVINEEDYRAARHFILKKGGSLYKLPGAGLNTNRFHPFTAQQRRFYRSKLGLRPGQLLLVSAGELTANKNHETILRALALLCRQNRCPPLRYFILGDGFLKAHLAQQIQTLELTDMVTLYGYCHHVPLILGCADLSLFPSHREGLGMAALESLAMGVPVIAADNRGTREYMVPRKTGYLCRSDDPAAFADAIAAFARLAGPERRAMKHACINAAKPFETRYSSAIMKRIYQSLGGEHAIPYHQHHHERLQSTKS